MNMLLAALENAYDQIQRDGEVLEPQEDADDRARRADVLRTINREMLAIRKPD